MTTDERTRILALLQAIVDTQDEDEKELALEAIEEINKMTEGEKKL